MTLKNKKCRLGHGLNNILTFLYFSNNYFYCSWRDDQPDGDRHAEVYGPGALPQPALVQPSPDHPQHVLPLGHPGTLFHGRYYCSRLGFFKGNLKKLLLGRHRLQKNPATSVYVIL